MFHCFCGTIKSQLLCFLNRTLFQHTTTTLMFLLIFGNDQIWTITRGWSHCNEIHVMIGMTYFCARLTDARWERLWWLVHDGIFAIIITLWRQQLACVTNVDCLVSGIICSCDCTGAVVLIVCVFVSHGGMCLRQSWCSFKEIVGHHSTMIL